MARVQVRLDGDVAEVIGRSAARHERSLSAEVNSWLRRQFHGPVQPDGRVGVDNTASTARASGRCLHPSGRVIGGQCGVCGARVARRR